MPLKTGGGFHSPFMTAASIDFAHELENYQIGSPSIPIYSNVTAKPYQGNMRELLAKQISSPVKWEAAIRDLLSLGANTFIETGPGKTLCGLVQRITESSRILNVEDTKSLKNTLEVLISSNK